MSARTRFTPAALGALAALALLVACSSHDAGRPRGEESSPAGPPRRLVSLIPSATETILALGAGDRLVARTDFDIDPRLAHLPSVGEGLTPSLEQLTLLAPDLVVAWPDNPSRSVIGRLAEMGVAVYTPEIQTLADMRRVTRELGELLDLREDADSLIAAIDSALEATRRAVVARRQLSVFYVVWYDPPTTAGPGTYIHELIGIAGGRNIFADAPGRWPQVSMEEVVRRQPEFILLSQTEERPIDVARLSSAVGWRELEAVREGRVVRIDANLYNRPGPRVTEAATRLARLLHPDAFRQQALP